MSPAAPAPISWRSPARWLALGWADLRANPAPGIFHGLIMAAIGAALFSLARDQFWLLAGAFSGFLIVAPILASGLYRVSAGRAEGRTVSLHESLAHWRSGDKRLIGFGLLLGLAGTGWVINSAGLITLLSKVPIRKPADFLQHVVLAPETGLFELWLLLGALLAAPVFASSVTALPALVATRASVQEAVGQSWRAVADHPLPMALWAAVIGLLVGLGMASAMIGLVFIVPLIAHASWHVYRDVLASQ